MLTLDLTALDRTANDNGVYNGVYAVALPKKVAVGQVLKLHVFLDVPLPIFLSTTLGLIQFVSSQRMQNRLRQKSLQRITLRQR